MLLEGKCARPIAHWAEIHRQALTAKIGAPVLVIQAPSGYLLTESLEALLEEAGRVVIWLRLEPEDNDPASLLLLLIRAFQRVDAHVGGETLAKMQRLPGPMQGWQGLFAHLGNECGSYIRREAVLVIEHLHHLSAITLALPLFCQTFLPLLPANFRFILTLQQGTPLNLGDRPIAYVEMADLQLDVHRLGEVLQVLEVRLPAACQRRAISLVQGRVVGLIGLGGAAQLLGLPFVERLLEKARSQGESFQQIARNCLGTFDQSDLIAVSILAHLGYYHPTIQSNVSGVESLPAGPWAQSLFDRWCRPYGLWREPLKAALRAAGGFQQDALCAAASYLCQHVSAFEGVWLFFKLGCLGQAAEYLSKHASYFLQAGLWESFERWLALLQGAELRQHPWLLQAGGELKTWAGDLSGAMQLFQQANAHFMRLQDAGGACASLLALSTAASWLGELGKAWSAADGARSLSEAAHMPWPQGWAEFQLACLAAQEGNLPPAAEHLQRAAELASRTGEPFMLECIHSVTSLLEEQQRLQRFRLRQQQALLDSECAEREQAERLTAVLRAPPGAVERCFPAHDWLNVPLMFKLPGADSIWMARAPERPVQPWKRWLSWLRPGAQRLHTFEPVRCQGFDGSAEFEAVLESEGQVDAALGATVSRASEAPKSGHQLTACFFGSFRIALDDAPVEKLLTGQGRRILEYLIYHHQHNLPRDQLMELLWPETSPEMARNRLNVALSGLRRGLRAATGSEVIVFEDGKYGLHPCWRVWLDVEEFESSLEAARRLESVGEIDQAIQRLEVAANLYQDDFLAEEPYEEWAISIRERLRLAYLDALYQLSRNYFQKEQHAACAALCQKILERDACREDVHCLLMRCYASQEQIPLALRQYQSCVEALRSELDVEPAASTSALYRQLRHREVD